MLGQEDIAVLMDLANLAIHTGFVAEGRTILAGIMAERPGFVPATIALAYSHLVVDQFEQTFALLEPVLAADPDDADARIICGLAHLLAGEREKAEEVLSAIPDDRPQKALSRELLQAL